MGKKKATETLSRRDVLKLAGTAAAFCASFGFLHGSQTGRTVQDKHLQMKWVQAELKWYNGSELLDTTPFPTRVLKHLQSNEAAVVELKFFRGGSLLRNMGTIEAKH
jgi:hypothetical protein